MHMADALLSPVVGGAMTAVSVTAIGYAVKKISAGEQEERDIPIMGVMGAFVFAAQMINFTIPGTGSSGHIGGGILLAALLGPYRALLTLASVLLIQCLFFADGGLLAFGCNVFNLGICSAVLAYRFFYQPIVRKGLDRRRITVASVVAVVMGLQLGAFGVVLETLASGVAQLPFSAFVTLMQPIHLAIGLVEGLITAAVLNFVASARPQLLQSPAPARLSGKQLTVVFLILTVIVSGGVSLFASVLPDGLEWAVEGVAGTSELEREGVIHEAAQQVVETTSLMPDYGFAQSEDAALGTSAAGLIGSLITIALAGGLSLLLSKRRRRHDRA